MTSENSPIVIGSQASLVNTAKAAALVREKKPDTVQVEQDEYIWQPISNVVGGRHHKERVRIVLNEIADTLARTFGPGGELTYIFDKHEGNHISTKDGYSVLKRMSFIDEISCLVLDTVRSSARRVARSAGDGSTTSVIMANYIFRELFGTEQKMPSSAVHAALESITTVIERHLTKSAIRVEHDSEALKRIATIAANNNIEVGSKIAKIFESTPNASVMVERGTGEEDEIVTRKGFRVYTPMLDSIFATSNSVNQVDVETCTLNNTLLLICDFEIQAIAFNTVIVPVMNQALETGQSFTLVAKDFSEDVKQAMYQFKSQNPSAPVLLMTHSTASPDSKNRMHDLAAYTNAKVITATTLNIDPSNPQSAANIDLLPLAGFATKINAYDSYAVVESEVHTAEFDVHIAAIEDQINVISGKDSTESNTDVIAKLERRLKELSNCAIVIHVGGRTEIEREYKFFSYEDAAVACTSALTDGITLGGAGGLGVLKLLKSNRTQILDEVLIEFKKITQLPMGIEVLNLFVGKIIDAYTHCLTLVYTNMKFSLVEATRIIDKCTAENLEYDIIQCKYFKSDETPVVVTPIKTDIAVLQGSVSIIYTLLCSNQTLISAPHLNDSINR